jgi:hypothetical protein
VEKTISIDGQEVKFKSTGATPLRFKAQFGKDYLSEIMKLDGLKNLKGKNGEINSKALQNLDFEVFYNIAWTLAKTGNKDIDDPITWLDKFETFPIIEIIPELQDMIIATIQSKKK